MKKLLLFSLSLISLSLYSQKFDTEHIGLKAHFRYSIGLGASHLFTGDEVYDLPYIDKDSGYVHIEKSSKIFSEITFAVTYSFFYYEATFQDENEQIEKIHYYAGLSAGVFFNPLDINLAENRLAYRPNLGLGIGWVFSGGAGIWGIVEIKEISQPTSSFLTNYGDGTKQYLIDGDIQYGLDYSDKSIMKSKTFLAIGLKITLPLNTFKSFKEDLKSVDNKGII